MYDEHNICIFYYNAIPIRRLIVFFYTILLIYIQLTKEKAHQEGEDYDVATSPEWQRAIAS